MKRHTAEALAKAHDMAGNKLRQKFKRHGIQPDRNGKYTEADYLKAKEMGAAMDKAALSGKVAEAEKAATGQPMQSPATLTYMKLQRQVKKLDIEIQMAQVDLDSALGKSVSMEKHKETVLAVQSLMISWYDQIIESIATKRKDAELLKELRAERDRISIAIMEVS